MPQYHSKELLSPAEAARLLACTRSAVTKMMKTGKIPVIYRTKGGRPLVRYGDVMAYHRKRKLVNDDQKFQLTAADRRIREASKPVPHRR